VLKEMPFRYRDPRPYFIGCERLTCAVCGPSGATADEAIAAWNASPRTVWHPIATAPKDRRILLWSADLDDMIVWTPEVSPDEDWIADTTHWAEAPKGPRE